MAFLQEIKGFQDFTANSYNLAFVNKGLVLQMNSRLIYNFKYLFIILNISFQVVP